MTPCARGSCIVTCASSVAVSGGDHRWRGSAARCPFPTRRSPSARSPLSFVATARSLWQVRDGPRCKGRGPSTDPRWSCVFLERLPSAPARLATRLPSNGQHVTFALVSDACVERRMILDRSEWRPASEAIAVPERRIVRTVSPGAHELPRAAAVTGSWPSFRGRDASGVADGQRLPDMWDGATGKNVLWRTAIPGLAHSSPDRVGRHGLRHQRDQQPQGRDLQAGALRRRRRIRGSFHSQVGALRHRQAHGSNALGARRAGRRTSQQASHQIDLRQCHSCHRRPHRRRMVRIRRHTRVRRQWRAAVAGGPWARRHGRLRHSDVRMGSGQLADHLERAGDSAVRHADGLVRARAQTGDRRNRLEDVTRRAVIVGNTDGGCDDVGAGAGDECVEFHPRL